MSILDKSFRRAMKAAKTGPTEKHPKKVVQFRLPDVTITLTRTTDGSNAPKVWLFPNTRKGDDAVSEALNAEPGKLSWMRSFPQGVGRFGEYGVVLTAFVGPDVETWGPKLVKDIKRRLVAKGK